MVLSPLQCDARARGLAGSVRRVSVMLADADAVPVLGLALFSLPRLALIERPRNTP